MTDNHPTVILPWQRVICLPSQTLRPNATLPFDTLPFVLAQNMVINLITSSFFFHKGIFPRDAPVHELPPELAPRHACSLYQYMLLDEPTAFEDCGRVSHGKVFEGCLMFLVYM